MALTFTNASGSTGKGFQVYNQDSGAWAARSLTQPAAGITISNSDGLAGDPTFALANDLAALEGLGSTGIAVRTAADTWTQRSLTAGTNITITYPDGVSGNPVINCTASSTPSDLNTVVAYTDFTNVVDSTNRFGYGWENNGGFDISLTPTEVGHPGIADNAGTGSQYVYSGFYNNGSGSLTLIFVGRIDAALASGDRLIFGFTDSLSIAAADPSDGIFFRGAFGDTNWQACTANSSTQTTTDTGVAIDTNWKEFKIEVNSAGTSAAFYLNGSLVATNTTNLPANATDLYAIYYCYSIQGGDCLIDAALLKNELGNRY